MRPAPRGQRLPAVTSEPTCRSVPAVQSTIRGRVSQVAGYSSVAVAIVPIRDIATMKALAGDALGSAAALSRLRDRDGCEAGAGRESDPRAGPSWAGPFAYRAKTRERPLR